MAGLGYGAGYQYGHDHPGNFTEQRYLPDDLKDRKYYRPTDNGAERTIRERLNSWWTSRKR
jgi:putative ATPase